MPAENNSRLYKAALTFFKAFRNTKHPNTVCWILEIVYLLAEKFKTEDVVIAK